MTRLHSRRAVIAGLLTAVVLPPTACGGSETASPTLSETTHQVSGAVSAKPSRPHDITLAGVDPCAVLTSEQRTGFGFDAMNQRGTDPFENGAPTCTMSNKAGSGWVTFITSTSTGIEVWLDGSRSGKAESITVVDFGAVQIRIPTGSDGGCIVAVDVADGQQLLAQYTPRSGTQVPDERRCDEAKTIAGAAIDTLTGGA